HLGLNVPLRLEPGGPIFGALMLSIDAAAYTEVLQEWPVPKRTGEVLLVRRDGDSVLYLTDLRNRPGSALHFRVPMSQRGVIAVQAVLGAQGAREGLDYRGVPIFAAIRPVPGSPWYLITKMDSAEVAEPMRR